jgi:putative ABC transport system permease protein
MTKFQRVYEAAIFKTLGATSRTMATMLVLEYGALGTLAGLVGSAGAVALTWGLTRFLFDIPWTPALGINAVGVGLTAVGVAAVGLIASLDVLRRKPLATLRAE